MPGAVGNGPFGNTCKGPNDPDLKVTQKRVATVTGKGGGKGKGEDKVDKAAPRCRGGFSMHLDMQKMLPR